MAAMKHGTFYFCMLCFVCKLISVHFISVKLIRSIYTSYYKHNNILIMFTLHILQINICILSHLETLKKFIFIIFYSLVISP